MNSFVTWGIALAHSPCVQALQLAALALAHLAEVGHEQFSEDQELQHGWVVLSQVLIDMIENPKY